MIPGDVERHLPVDGTGRTIYGTLREVPDSSVLVVFSHGLAGGRDDLQPYTGSLVLAEAGISSYRFNYYGYESDARDLLDCTIDDHVEDLRLVLRTLKQEAPSRRLVVVGHSLGGLVAVAAAAEEMAALVLWDATHSHLWSGTVEDADTQWEPRLGLYRMRWGIDVLLSREFLESYRFLDCDALARRVSQPMLAVAAGQGVLREGQQRYVDNWAGPAELVVLAEANHQFTRADTLQELLATTTTWIQRRYASGEEATGGS